VVRIIVGIVAIFLIVAVPLVIFDDARLEMAREIGLVPGRDAEQLADGDDGALLIVLPLGDYNGVGRERYAYKAAYISRSAVGGTSLTDIETDETIDVPLTSVDFVASDPEGAHVLLRGPGAKNPGVVSAVLVTTADNSIVELPDGQLIPDLPGDWETETWQKTTGLCDRVSPHQKFVACFNRADAASYLAGDWQLDAQLFGDYEIVEPVYRGIGFLPMVGFAHNDTWVYLQNETGIYRVELPESLLERAPTATPIE
jgi:hypothetical protein